MAHSAQNDRKTFALILLSVAGVVVFIMLMIYGFTAWSRWMAATSVQKQVYSPRPGIECFIATGTDGVATDCYPIPKN